VDNLVVTLIQADLSWENSTANIADFDRKIDLIEKKPHVILLPEKFATGFSMNAVELAESMEGESVSWMREKAKTFGSDIAGSLIIRDGDKFYNRLVWVKSNGEILTCDKRHLFSMAGEDRVYSSGESCITVDVNGWRIRPFICYDLRFPVWSRNLEGEYDVAVYLANWPERRAFHWKTLLSARAIENQCYVVGVNRVGVDGNGISYGGDSSVFDPEGNTLFQRSDVECVHTESLSCKQLERLRKEFPVLMDADRDIIRNG